MSNDYPVIDWAKEEGIADEEIRVPKPPSGLPGHVLKRRFVHERRVSFRAHAQ